MGRFVTDPCANSSERPSIGLLGGTFDPVHSAHLLCALKAKEALGLDKVILIPAAHPSFKRDRDLADFSDRVAMCRLATEGIDGLEVSAIEGDRPGITYTIDTLEELASSDLAGAKLYFLIGSDAFKDLGKWKRGADVAKLVDFAVFLRSDDDEDRIRDVAESVAAKVKIVASERMDVSSSDIRRDLRDGVSVEGLLDEDVLAYIDEKGLYRD